MKSYFITTGNSCEQLIISSIRVSYEDYSNGNPYNTIFSVKVISGDFAGVSEFEYNIEDFIRFVKEIKDLYDFKLRQVELNDICYGSNIQFCLDKTGHITILGTIYGKSAEHSLTFIFTTDQTAIETFCKSLYKDFITENVHKL
ncbi:hypothetical protein G9F72_019410 [Clostridium estertheticum]|uniref:WapI family immunity protein n=1 Tax=Clostridium estertheticum TaxID=238834 RepID=UPI0013E97240|nr:hypothetical protein [Clostridium estertheticum]MBZ9688501.1 hypothetical protein [Clostridium estertheticum]